IMPRIHQRTIERLKSNRTLNVTQAKPVKPVSREDKPVFNDRRSRQDRRKVNRKVPFDRRRQDRRLAYQRASPALKTFLENADESTRRITRREGQYIDETV
ncbi:MAG: hypothetical protein CUN57_03020, partial [Phototrophicales bacterium]